MTLSRRDLLASSAAIAGTTAVASAAITQDEAEARATGKPGNTPHTKFALNVEMWGMGIGFYDRIYKAHELGFPAVEFWPWHNKDLAHIAEIVAETGIAQVVGRMTAEKGLDLLMDALPLLNSAFEMSVLGLMAPSRARFEL